MPTLSRTEIVDAISDGRIGAVSFDTTVFDNKQKNFRQRDLLAMARFKRRNIPVLITDVVEREMISHLDAEASDTQRALKTALRSHDLRWHRPRSENEAANLLLDESPAEFARREFDAFAEEIGASTLRVADIPDGLSELFRRYFSVESPFAAKASRKTEFPDAAALLRLETYAREKGTVMICIAQDKAWTEFAATSDHLVAMFPLNDVLGMFSEAYKDQDLADEIVKIWLEGGQDDFDAEVRDAIVDRLGDVDFDVQAESTVSFDAEAAEAELLHIDKRSLTAPIVLAADEGTVTFSIDVTVKGKFGAQFSFAIWDGIDSDYVSLGEEWAETEADATLSLTIVADRDVSEGIRNPEISVSQRQFGIDFGYVDPFDAEDLDDGRY